MKCKECKNLMRKITVRVEGATRKAIAYECKYCGNIEFDKKSGLRVVAELERKAGPLKVEQKIIKLSHDRLGTYFNKNVVKSINLKAGENVKLVIPDKKHIILERD